MLEKRIHRPLLGCIADDFTGASDLANNLVRAGMRTIQSIGVPADSQKLNVDAIVISLKSRTISTHEAIKQSLQAYEWLKAQGVEQFYFKYCSTFDSTPQGNIGPVTEALMDVIYGKDIDLFVNRIHCYNPLTNETLAKMAEDITEVTKDILPDEKLDCVAYGCTSGTVAAGYESIKEKVNLAKPEAQVTTPITSTIKALKKLIISKKPPCVLVTGYAKDDVINDATIGGIEHVIAKPINASLLFETILSIFNLEAPEHNAQKNHSNHIKIDLNSLKGSRILLVEDNLLNQQIATEILEDEGFIVEIANNGEEAVNMTNQSQYDIVLMDMQMPVMDGLEATKAIRQKFPNNDLPILAMTANASDVDRDKCLEAGMDAHITKPIDPNLLFVGLAKWIKVKNSNLISDQKKLVVIHF